jgi:Tfp pilus assembly protein PilF
VRRVVIPVFLLAALALPGADTVSLRELTVPDKAKDKYEDAQRRIAKRDIDGARRKLTEALSLAPEYSAAWNAMGTISTDPEANFRRALQSDPDNLDAVLNLGGYLLKIGRTEDALGYNQRAAFELTGDATAQAQLGMNLYQLGKLNEAERALLAAKRLDPAQPSLPQLFLAEIYARRGEKSRAAAEIQELLALRPAEPLATTLRATISKLQ